MSTTTASSAVRASLPSIAFTSCSLDLEILQAGAGPHSCPGLPQCSVQSGCSGNVWVAAPSPLHPTPFPHLTCLRNSPVISPTGTSSCFAVSLGQDGAGPQPRGGPPAWDPALVCLPSWSLEISRTFSVCHFSMPVSCLLNGDMSRICLMSCLCDLNTNNACSVLVAWPVVAPG